MNIICLHLSQHLAAAPYALKQDELTKVSDTSVIGSPSPPAGAAHCVLYCLLPAPVCARLLFIKSHSYMFQLVWVQLPSDADQIVASLVAEAQRCLMTQAP